MSRKPARPALKPGLHPRNPHRERYDFEQLIHAEPALKAYVKANPHGGQTVDFSNAEAVKTLNKALLACFYQVHQWDLPPGYLCPPVPGRADYIHHLADLLADANGGSVPEGKTVRGLDVGTGANLIYPIIGSQAYGWQFVGADIDPISIASAKLIVESNPVLKPLVTLRKQKNANNIFTGMVKPSEQFDFSLCNPPFHSSEDKAAAGTERKHRNLSDNRRGRGQKVEVKADRLNFGGQNAELWCPGGEAAFVQRMIEQSALIPTQLCWFTSLISSKRNLPGLYKALKKAGAATTETIDMAQGQKQSRILAWSFLTREQRKAWAKTRWQ